MRKRGSFIYVLIAGCVCLLGACSSGENAANSATDPEGNPRTSVIREAAAETTPVAADCSARGFKADLHGCDLAGADLTGANLTNATLAGVQMNQAKMTEATLTGVSSGGILGYPASLPTDYRVIKGYLIGPKVNLSGYAYLVDANLTGANLSGADLSGVDLSYAQLIGANLTGAIMSRANLYYANLANADLSGADLRFAGLVFSTLTGVTWSNTTCPDGYVQSTECVRPAAG